MNIFIKITSFIFALLFVLGYGWWDRSEANILEIISLLGPPIGLLVIAVVPFKVASSMPAIKWALSIVCGIAIASLMYGIFLSFNTAIEPHKPAILLRLFGIGLLASGLYIIWASRKESNHHDGGSEGAKIMKYDTYAITSDILDEPKKPGEHRFLVVPEGTDVTTLPIEPKIEVTLFKQSISINKGDELIGVNADQVIKDIDQQGYAFDAAAIDVSITS